MNSIHPFRTLAALAVLSMGLAGAASAAATASGRSGNNLSTLGVGQDWTCAINSVDEVVCWFEPDSTVFQKGISGARQISVSHTDTCAVNRHGDVYCWWNDETPAMVPGFGKNGGGGTSEDRFAVAAITNAGIASGAMRCILVKTGKVYCWGENEDRQLGDGTTTPRESPVPVPNVTEAVALFTGSSGSGTLTCAVRLSGGVRCWGDGAPGPYAIANVDGVRAVSIGLGGLCVWRSVQSLSRIYCTAPTRQSISNFANFTELPGLSYPQALAGNIYGGACVADSGQTDAWKCKDHFYGLTQAPAAGFMTTLPFNATLVFGDFQHSCAEYQDRSVSCLRHGMLVPPCDLATQGANCIDAAGSPDPSGTWSRVPNLKMAQQRKPEMFGKTSLHKLEGRTSSTLSFSWLSPAQTTEHQVRICNQFGQCVNVSASQIVRNGNRYSVTVGSLAANTDYTLLVTPSNWASVQQSFGYTARTLN